MRSVSVRLSDIGKIVVPIGFVGENMRTAVYIDCKKVFDEYPNAEARLTVYSPGGIAYPASVTRNSNIVEWIISDADLIDHGTGEYQLSFINENTVVKSYIGKTKVFKSIVPTGDVPSPIENWIIRAENTLDSIPEAIQSDLNDAMAEITAQAQNLQPGSSATAYYDVNNKVIIFGIPEGTPGTNGTNGIDGQDGYSPIATVTKRGSTAIITIQDANGTTSASVTDGVDGVTPSFSIGTVETVSPDTDASATITGTDENPVLNLRIPRGLPGEITESEMTEALSEKADVINVSDDHAENVKSFTDGAKDQPMAVSIKIEPVQDLHGYDNPWPAGGGKNKFDKDTAVLDVRIGIDGQEIADPGYYASDYIPVTAGTTYVKNSPTSDAYHRFAVYASDKSFLRVANDSQQIVTIYENESYIRICGLQTELNTAQVEIGSVSTDYIPYSNVCPISGWNNITIVNVNYNDPALQGYTRNEYVIAIPSACGTVYGGLLTINKDGTGKLTIDRAFDQVSVDNSWTDGGDHKFYKTDALTYENKTAATLNTDKFISNVYPFKGTGDTDLSDMTMDKRFYLKWQNKRLLVRDDRFETVSDFITAFANVPMQVVYLLKQETEYTLTAEQVNALITSLHGVNNLYADSGDILSVDYSADTKAYIDDHNESEDNAITGIRNMIAASDSPIATENHVIGDVFVCNNALYRAKDVIIAGETITTGSGGNSEIINLTDYISEKNTALQTLINLNTSHIVNFRKIYPTPEAPLEKFGDDFENMSSYGVSHSKIGNVYYLQGKNSTSTYWNYSWHCGVVKAVSISSSVPGYNEEYLPFVFQTGVRHCIKIHFPKYYEVGADAGKVIVRLLKADSEHAQSFTSICTADGYDHEYYFTPSDGDRYGFIMYVRNTTMDMAVEITVFSAPEETQL